MDEPKTTIRLRIPWPIFQILNHTDKNSHTKSKIIREAILAHWGDCDSSWQNFPNAWVPGVHKPRLEFCDTSCWLPIHSWHDFCSLYPKRGLKWEKLGDKIWFQMKKYRLVDPTEEFKQMLLNPKKKEEPLVREFDDFTIEEKPDRFG